MKKITVQISGMRCGGCASGVERSLSRLTGVVKASADAAKKEAKVEFDNEKLQTTDIKAAIEKLGYVVEGYYENN